MSHGFAGMAVGGVLMLATTARAEMAPPYSASPDFGSPQSHALASQSASADIAGKPEQALVLADRAIAADVRDPWGHYDRAEALGQLKRVDDAIAEYKQAQRRFSTEDAWGRAVAIWGLAHMLAEVGRCVEAKAAFGEYAAFVKSTDANAAEMAAKFAAACGRDDRTPVPK